MLVAAGVRFGTIDDFWNNLWWHIRWIIISYWNWVHRIKKCSYAKWKTRYGMSSRNDVSLCVCVCMLSNPFRNFQQEKFMFNSFQMRSHLWSFVINGWHWNTNPNVHVFMSHVVKFYNSEYCIFVYCVYLMMDQLFVSL